MRGSIASSQAVRWAFVAGVGFLGAGCTLTSPGCRNPDVKAAIEQEARESIDLFQKTIGSKEQLLTDGTPIRLIEAVELSRQETTRECSADIVVGKNGELPVMPIEYEVTAGDNGQAPYRWNKVQFGGAFVSTTVLSIISKYRKVPSQRAGPAPKRQTNSG